MEGSKGRHAVLAATAIASTACLAAAFWWARTNNNDSNKISDNHHNHDDELLEEDERLETALKESRDKLQDTALSLQQFCPGSSTLQMKPCIRLAQLRGYRCRFTLQVIVEPQQHDQDSATATRLQFAIRKDGKPIPLNSGTYKFANVGLRATMRKILDVLNRRGEKDDDDDPFFLLKKNLTSVSFLSSWDSQKFNLVTFHYNGPIGDDVVADGPTQGQTREQAHSLWRAQASRLQEHCGAVLISGRAKKVLIRSCLRANNAIINNPDNEIGTDDIIVLQKRNEAWNAYLSAPPPANDTERVQYETDAYIFKPEGAFCHPNSNVMLEALTWMLGRLSWISQETPNGNKLEMLELYCGCGAHTIPIAKSGLVTKVTCVELDDRLVSACQHNIRSNGLQDLVRVISQDAGTWAKYGRRNHHYDILLVDPPRQGLDDDVKRLALNGGNGGIIEDIIYISCGRDALVRDLKVLTQTHFEVVDCTLVDLFPGTDSVESLVHLRRKKER
mmetsp:Transcript_14257/g.39601  ORF Transcript_14257/g.39601 Transcript_14257/m.39601 type:complete len:503 (+) Transcript_14257:43-1551(+)